MDTENGEFLDFVLRGRIKPIDWACYNIVSHDIRFLFSLFSHINQCDDDTVNGEDAVDVEQRKACRRSKCCTHIINCSSANVCAKEVIQLKNKA